MVLSAVKHPFLTIDYSVIYYIYAPSVLKAFEQAQKDGTEESFVWPVLPPRVGQLTNPLAFPQVLEISLEGKPQDAGEETWKRILLRQLQKQTFEPSLYDEYLIKPTYKYNVELLTFHMAQLSWQQNESFITYLRDLLLSAEDDPDGVLLDTLGWLESKSRQLRIERLKNEETRQAFGAKERVLAFKLMFEYEFEQLHIPKLESGQPQIDYIAQQVERSSSLVKRYLSSNRTRTIKPQYKIYKDEYFLKALAFIKIKWPEVDTELYQLSHLIKS